MIDGINVGQVLMELYFVISHYSHVALPWFEHIIKLYPKRKLQSVRTSLL